MEFSKPTKKRVVNGLTKTLAHGTGLAAGGAMGNIIPIDDKTAQSAIMTVAGLLGVSSLKGSDKQSKIVKSLMEGIATRGMFDLVSGQIRSAINISDDDSLIGKAANGALGLNSPEKYDNLAAPEDYTAPKPPVVYWDDDKRSNDSSYSMNALLNAPVSEELEIA